MVTIFKDPGQASQNMEHAAEFLFTKSFVKLPTIQEACLAVWRRSQSRSRGRLL